MREFAGIVTLHVTKTTAEALEARLKATLRFPPAFWCWTLHVAVLP